MGINIMIMVAGAMIILTLGALSVRADRDERKRKRAASFKFQTGQYPQTRESKMREIDAATNESSMNSAPDYTSLLVGAGQGKRR